MFRATLMLPVETLEQPFIPLSTHEYIQLFLKIVGYQGFVDKVNLLWWDFIHCVQQKKNVIWYPRFTKLIIADIMTKFESIPKILEEDYHLIKDDIPLVSVYSTGEVTVRGMLIPNDLLTDEIQDTQAYKDYEEKFKGVDVPTIQPKPVESTQGMNRTPRATRTPNPTDVVQKKRKGTQVAGETSSPRKSLKIRFMQQKPSTTTPPPPSDDRKQSDGTEFVDSVFLNEEDSNDRIELESHKDKHNEINDDDDDETKDDKKDHDDHDDHALIKTRRTGSSKVRTEKMQTPIPSPSRSPRKDLSLDKAITEELTGIKEKVGEVLHDIVPKIALNATKDQSEDKLPWIVANAIKKERESSQAAVPALISQEFTAHAPKITAELFRIHMQNTILNVHPITSASTATITSDLQEQLYLKMKSDLQAQVVDPVLWNVLRAKFEKSSPSAGSYGDDSFQKCDHDEHQGDDAPPDGEKSAKRKKDI
ncbi:hypothetical protein Tco_0407172 [Tanacetum coccineum]